jgi:hypothetical protein
MPNPLDPIRDAYIAARDALTAVGRANTSDASLFGPRERPTVYLELQRTALVTKLSDTRSHLADLATLSLTATFEAELRSHLLSKSPDAQRPFPGLVGEVMMAHYEEMVDRRLRFEDIVKIFGVADHTVGEVMAIWNYRTWIAHGRRKSQPPQTDPDRAYRILTDFLIGAKLI